jgi:hypothetical protein
MASVCERTIPTSDRLSAKLVPIFADRRCHVVSATYPYSRILGFLDRNITLLPLINTHIVCRTQGLQPVVRVPPGVREDILGDTLKHLTSIKTKHRIRMNFKPALILSLTKIRPGIQLLACQKQAQSSH